MKKGNKASKEEVQATQIEKSLLEWLEEAKELGYEWADAAIANYKVAYAAEFKAKVDHMITDVSIKDAVSGGFGWDLTPQGHDYWEEIWMSL